MNYPFAYIGPGAGFASPGSFLTTSDCGESFGVHGYFGHGPIQHDKVFEVPFAEGKLR